MPTTKHIMSDIAARAEAFLLAEGGALSIRKLSQLLGSDEATTHTALQEISQTLEGTGITLVQTDSEASLSTAPSMSETLRKAFEETLSREIGNAALEVIAIVLYRGASTRARIDYIRGVNTSSTIRLLLSRGLLERIQNPEDSREYLYRPTTDLLAHLGVSSASALPEYATIRTELENFEKSQSAFDHHDTDTAQTAENT
jgi:segregation and condensation protein B